MTPCPDDDVLRRLIADTLAASDLKLVEDHLGECAACRERLDAQAGVAQLGTSPDGATRLHSTRPPRLGHVIERLRADYEHRFDSPTDASATGPVSDSASGGELLPPGRFRGIEIRRQLGRGGMGIVYEGHDSALNRTVAIKVLSPHLTGDARARDRFLREAQAAAALHHEHVVAIHAIDQIDGTPFLVLQYVPGESLAARLDRVGKLPSEEVARIGIAIARGLAAAHARGLVHRDIKPANILLEEETNRVLIADFGLARAIGDVSITAAGTVAGTPAFMSPEQASDGPVDARSDLFSTGVVLYLAATGVQPFTGPSPFVILERVRTVEPKPLRELDPSLPEWFCTIVHRLLAKDPAHRVPSAAELAELLAKRVSVARPPAGGTTDLAADGPGRSHARPWWAAVAVLVLGLAGGLIAWPYFRPEPVSPTVPAAPARAPGFYVADRTDPFPTLADAVAMAADGATITVEGPGPYRSPAIRIVGKQLTVRAAAGSVPRFEPAGEGSPTLITTDRDLTLEGLEIAWPVQAPPFAATEDPLERCVIGASGGRLAIVSSRITCGRAGACVGTVGGTMTLERSHLIAEIGWCVFFRPGHGPLEVEGCQFEGLSGFAVGVAQQAPPLPRLVRCTANTFACGRVWHLFATAPPARPVIRIVARRNVIDSEFPVALFGMRPRQSGDLSTHDAMADAVRALATWSDEANVYRQGSIYLSSSMLGSISTVHRSRLRSLTEWQEFWNLSPARSVEAGIRFEPRSATAARGPLRILGFDNATGPIPEGVGCDPDRVGPVAAPTGG